MARDTDDRVVGPAHAVEFDDRSTSTPQAWPQTPPALTDAQRQATQDVPPLGQVLAAMVGDIAQLRQAIDTRDVIGVDLVQLDAQGAAELDLNGPELCKSIAVVNYTGALMTVSGSGRQTTAPLAGSNTFILPASSFLQVPVLSRFLTIYGDASAVQAALVIRFASVKPIAGGSLGNAGAGSIAQPALTTPAAGAQLADMIVPAGQRWRFKDFSALFTASAVVATRTITWLILDAAGRVVQAIAGPTFAASASGRIGLTSVATAQSTPQVFPFDTLADPLPAGWAIRLVVGLIDAGDTITVPVLTVVAVP